MYSYLEKEVPIIEGDNPRYADEVFYSANIVQVFALLLGKSKAELFENLVETPTEAMRHITMEDLEFLLK